MKICFRCKQSKPLSEFHKKTAKKDGLNPSCKQCVNALWNEKQYRTPEENRAHVNAWAANNRQRVRDRAAQWVKDNPEKHRENCKRWRANNLEKARQVTCKSAQTYRENNKQKVLLQGKNGVNLTSIKSTPRKQEETQQNYKLHPLGQIKPKFKNSIKQQTD